MGVDMSALHLLGIYPMQLEKAMDSVKSTCAEYGIDDDELWQFIWQDMDEFWGTEENHLSNQLVDIMYHNLHQSLKERGIESSYYINGGLDTHFYIDHKEV